MREFDIDEILLEANYKSKKGYIDLESIEDIQLLENTMYDMGYDSNLITGLIQNLTEARPNHEIHKDDVYRFNPAYGEKIETVLDELGVKVDFDMKFIKTESPSNPALFLAGYKNVQAIPKNELKLYLDPTKYNYKKSEDGTLTLILKNGKNLEFNIITSKFGITATEYEMLICIAYNQKYNKLKLIDAIKKSGANTTSLIEKYISLYEKNINFIKMIQPNLKNFGTYMENTGGGIKNEKKDLNWPGNNSTPKTDIYTGISGGRISVKKSGSSRLMSGSRDEAVGTFKAAIKFYDKFSKKSSLKLANEIIKDIAKKFDKRTIEQGIGDTKDMLNEKYIDYRFPKIKDELIKKGIKYNDIAIKLHAAAEAKLLNITSFKKQPNEKDFIPGIKKNKTTEEFFEYLQSSKKIKQSIKDEIIDIYNLTVVHNDIFKKINKEFTESPEFKMWTIYEAATGVHKFSGETKKAENTTKVSIAEKILIFNTSDGNIEISEINEDWAKKKINNTDINVEFKSASNTTYSTFQLMTSENKDVQSNKNFIESIIDEELDILKMNTNSPLNFEEGLSDIVDFVSDSYKSVTDFVTNLYNNVFKKILNKLIEFAKIGIDYLLRMLGIEVEGTALVDVQF